MSYRWIRIQTHVHTKNSDGNDTLRDMAYEAGKNGADVIFLTDHNTMYGYENVENIYDETGVKIVKGIEYTTFYGHIISIGAPYFRWETLKDDSLNKLADHVHRYGGIIGIAHPMAIGNPICTGGRYKFRNTDFNKIDFMEQWHGIVNRHNEHEKNRRFWMDRAEEGYMITALYGGDFHKREQFKESGSFNWILIDELKEIESASAEGIKNGRIVMSKGPFIDLAVIKEEKVYNTGEQVDVYKNEKVTFIINVGNINEKDDFDVYLINNREEKIHVDICSRIDFVNMNYNQKVMTSFIEISIDDEILWMRMIIKDKKCGRLMAETNPVYFKHKG